MKKALLLIVSALWLISGFGQASSSEVKKMIVTDSLKLGNYFLRPGSGSIMTGRNIPVVDAHNLKGNVYSVYDSIARNNIPSNFRDTGMIVITTINNSAYQLQGGTANSNWNLLLLSFSQVDSLIALRNGLPLGYKNQLPFVLSDNTNIYRSGDPVNVGRRYVLSDAQLTDAKTTFTSFKDIFDTWNKFSVYNTTPNPYTAEKDSWHYNDTTGTINTTLNSNSYIGFYSPKKYKNYTLSGTLSASNEPDLQDDDIVSVVIAAVTGADGKLKTLSLVSIRNTQPEFKIAGAFVRYSIIYNLGGSDAIVIANGDNLPYNISAPWDNHQRDFKIVRAGDSITTTITNYDDAPGGKGALRFPLKISLTDFEQTQVFRNGASYGFGALSQANATFTNVNVNVSEDAIYDLRRPFNVWLPSSGGLYSIDTSAHFEHTRQWFHNPLYNFWAYVDGNDSLRVITTNAASTGNADSLNHQPASYYVSNGYLTSNYLTETQVNTIRDVINGNINDEQTARENADASLTDSLSNTLHKTGDETKTNGNLVLNDNFVTQYKGYKLSNTSTAINFRAHQGILKGSTYFYAVGSTYIKRYNISDTTFVDSVNVASYGLTNLTNFNSGFIRSGKLYIPTYGTGKTAIIEINADLTFSAELTYPAVAGEYRGIAGMGYSNDTIYVTTYEEPNASHPTMDNKVYKYSFADRRLRDSITLGNNFDVWRPQGIIIVNDTGWIGTDNGDLVKFNKNNGSVFALVYKPYFDGNNAYEGMYYENNNIVRLVDSASISKKSWLETYTPITTRSVLEVLRNARLNLNGYSHFNGNATFNGNIAITAKNRLYFRADTSLIGDFAIYQPDRSPYLGIWDSTNTLITSFAQGGNVGFGTSSPSYRVHVAGTFGVTGASTFSNSIASTSTAAFATSNAGLYVPITLTNNATSGSSVNGVSVGFSAYNGSAVSQMGTILLSSSAWTFGSTFVANQFMFNSGGSGGVGFRNISGGWKFYSGNASTFSAPQVFEITSTGGLSNTGTTPNANAVLELASTTKGALLPRMNRTQFAAITATQGNLAYGTLLDKFIYSNGTTVKSIDDSATISAKYRQIADTAANGTSTMSIAQGQKRIDSLAGTINSNYVHLTGNETIAGTKTFSGGIFLAGQPVITASLTQDNLTNDIKLLGLDNSSKQLRTVVMTTGQTTISANGSATSFTIAHGLTFITSTNKVFLTPRNALSKGYTYADLDATNITIYYNVAPAAGSLKFDWQITP